MAKRPPLSAAERIVSRIDYAPLRGNDERQYRLAITDVKPVRPRTGWLYLAIMVVDADGRKSRTPLAMGIVSGGGRLVMPWFELRIDPAVAMADGSSLDARGVGLEAGFINLLGELVPAGGHLMIEYESPGQSETHAELLLRVPPAVTHLGFLMYQAGFRGEFKDWYISEGGHEGPRKLQANKSPTPAAARRAREVHRAELSAFLKRQRPDDLQAAAIIAKAQSRARELLKGLRRKSR